MKMFMLLAFLCIGFFIIGKNCRGLRRRCGFRYYRGSFWIFLYFNGICRNHNAG